MSAAYNPSPKFWRDSLANLNELISDISRRAEEFSPSNTNYFVSTCLVILDRLIYLTQIWSQLSEEVRIQSATNILLLIEELTVLLHKRIVNNGNFYFSGTNTEFVTTSFNSDWGSSVEFRQLQTFSLIVPIGALNHTAKETFGASAIGLTNFASYLTTNSEKVANSNVLMVMAGTERGTLLNANGNDKNRLKIT